MTTLQTLESQLAATLAQHGESSPVATYLREKIAEYRVIREEALEEAAQLCEVGVGLSVKECALSIRNLKG